MDGGWDVEFLGENALAAIRPAGADGKKSKADQSLARAGWCRFSLAVQLSYMTHHPKATLDGANSIDIIAEFPKSASRPFRREPQ
ncbi:MAG: hypothetical protein ACREFU_08945 [Acetobacteraceae bacterium]